MRRRISRASSPQVGSRDLPVLLSKKSSLSDSSQGGSFKLKQSLQSKHMEKAMALITQRECHIIPIIHFCIVTFMLIIGLLVQ